MNSKKNLVFLGMMGSGKSSIGYLVSKKLKLKFVDIDHVIEDKIKMKITDIFSKKGEDYFRNLEEEITINSLKNNIGVISLGGGAFINKIIREEVLTNHHSFWLNWSAQILLKRIKDSKKRPLVFNSTNKELVNLIKKRSKVYSKAEFKIDCDKLTKSEIVKIIIKINEIN